MRISRLSNFTSFENVAWLLGEKGDYATGWSHIGSLEYCMIVSQCIEEHCDPGELVLCLSKFWKANRRDCELSFSMPRSSLGPFQKFQAQLSRTMTTKHWYSRGRGGQDFDTYIAEHHQHPPHDE